MRRILVLAFLSLTIPTAARADGIDLLNKFGTIAISNAGIISKGSELRQFNGIANGHSLGSVSFATGALLSGSIQAGGTFSSLGSFFKVIGIGNGGQPKGVIFSGAFVGPISWTLVSKTGPSLIFQLSGALSGQLFNGHIVSGTTTQLFHTTSAQLREGVVHVWGIPGRIVATGEGQTHLAATPEPRTMVLMGLGLLGIASKVRRRFSNDKATART
jgi:PEP-CTERM motif